MTVLSTHSIDSIKYTFYSKRTHSTDMTVVGCDWSGMSCMRCMNSMAHSTHKAAHIHSAHIHAAHIHAGHIQEHTYMRDTYKDRAHIRQNTYKDTYIQNYI